MRFFLILLSPAIIYLAVFRNQPAAPVVKTAAVAPATVPGGSSDFLKRPLDRTQEVMRQVKSRTGEPAGE
jgi:hypothetical protein